MEQAEKRVDRIEALLKQLEADELFIEDESSQHAGNRVETHFKILVVSDAFRGLTRLARQQTIMGLLAGEFAAGLHAVHIRALTIEEYQAGQGKGFVSPSCGSRFQRH